MIRKFQPAENQADFVNLKSAYLELANAPDALKFLSYSGQPFDEQILTDWLRNHVAAGVDYFGALDEAGKILGIAVIKSNPVNGFELMGLVVDARQRGRGIGKQLVEHIIGVAQQAGFRAIETAVFADNQPMLRLVIGFGFQPVRMDFHRRYDGMDGVYLKKYL